MFVVTPESVAKKIGVPVAEWTGRCHEIAALCLVSGVTTGTLRYGLWHGPVKEKRDRQPVHHGWVEVDPAPQDAWDIGVCEICLHVQDEHSRHGILNACTINGCGCEDFVLKKGGARDRPELRAGRLARVPGRRPDRARDGGRGVSYRIAMNVRHSIAGEVALLAAFARVVWPENQDEMEVPSGHLDDERPVIDKIRVWRELGDDIEIIGAKTDLSALTLADALVRQWEDELKEFLPALAEAGIKIVKTEVEGSGVIVMARDWENNRAQRAETCAETAVHDVGEFVPEDEIDEDES